MLCGWKVELRGGDELNPVLLNDTDRLKDGVHSDFLGWEEKITSSPDCYVCHHHVVGQYTGDTLMSLLISVAGCALMQTDLSKGGMQPKQLQSLQ